MKKIAVVLLSTVVCGTLASAKIVQQFEPEKDTSAFKGKPEVSLATDLSFYYQGIGQDIKGTTTNGTTYTTPASIESGLILPTANFDINAKIMSGFNVKLQTMLASHHHNDTYVKGGYATIDNLDFIAPGFLSEFMRNATIKIGVNDINYGDDQYRRTDNANVMRNPFINNMAVEGYLQGTHVELLYRIPSISSFAMVGITNGQANPQDVTKTEYDNTSATASSNRYGIYTKLGFDQQINDDLRFRATESVYIIEGANRNDLYSSDKAGNVMTTVFGADSAASMSSGWNAMSGYVKTPAGTYVSKSAADVLASKTNLFLKYKDTELYGMYEIADGADVYDKSMTMNHYAVDLVQRFNNDKFWLAARYENAVVEYQDAFNDFGDAELTQWQLTAGWFLSKNAVAKIEYIDQERENFSIYRDGKASFNGFMINASLSF
ncbi:MAG: hypothetical protein H6Q35_1634 [Proteobacteria bacterium]|nr:hypothetical protein [Pseudomonadota bacterium]